MTLIVRIFFVGLVAFTPTDEEPGKDWLALLLDAQDEYGIATHSPGLHYCGKEPACTDPGYRELRNTRLHFSVEGGLESGPEPEHFQLFESPGCDPDRLQAPHNRECAKDYRWIVGLNRTLGRDTKRRWCSRDWWMLRACNTLSHVILEQGKLQNCRFVEGRPPTLPTGAIYGLAGLRGDGRSRVASEVSMVKIEVRKWQEGDRFVLHLRTLPYLAWFRPDEPIELEGRPCSNDPQKQRCIDILIHNLPHHQDGQTYRSLIADHFDLYRRVWQQPGGKVQIQLNEGLQVPLDLQPCGNDESPLLAGELVLGAGNERPICPQNAGN